MGMAFGRLFVCCAALMAAAGCTQRITDFTVISTKNQQATVGLVQGPRATGEDCVVVVFFPFGIPNLKQAIDRAIEEAGPGYDALADGVVYYKNKSFLFGTICYEVQGTPVKTTSRKASIEPGGLMLHSGVATAD